MLATQFLFKRRDIPQRTKQQFVREILFDGLAEKRQRVFVLLGLTPPTSQPNHLGAVRKTGVPRLKRPRNNCGETGQGQDVDGVVMEHRHQAKDFVRAHVFEIDIGNQFPRQVALPFHAQNLIFELYQSAAIESQVP